MIPSRENIAATKLNVPVATVATLIKEQFPHWAHLQITKVEPGGWDNMTFRLGSEMLIRMPSAACYAEKVPKEQELLPLLAKQLSVAIPTPIALGKPSAEYPFAWSIYTWIEGSTADTLKPEELAQFAFDTAQFLNELRTSDTTGGPLPGTHNFFRGAHPSVYDADTQTALQKLQGIIDIEQATAIWNKALRATWQHAPVWIHGDFSPGNILVKNGKLTAVIDFGGTAVGDPACDLVLAWTFFDDKSREIFKSTIDLDEDTWARARGWGLWKALITLADIEDKESLVAQKQKNIISAILDDANI